MFAANLNLQQGPCVISESFWKNSFELKLLERWAVSQETNQVFLWIWTLGVL